MFPIHRAWLILAACCSLQGAGQGILLNCVGQFYVPVSESLGVSRGVVATYVSIQLLFTVVTLPLAGKLFPLKNIRFLVSCATAVFCSGVALLSLCGAIWQWYLVGVINGVAGAFIFALPTVNMIGNWFQKKNGLAMGIATAFAGIVPALANPALSHCIVAYGWRASYVVMAATAALMILPFSLFVMDLKPQDAGMKPYGWDGRENDGGTVGGVPYDAAKKTAAFALLLAVSGGAGFLSYYTHHLPGFAKSLGLSTIVGGTMLSAAMIGNTGSKLFLGALSERIGVRNSASAVLALMGCAYGALAFFTGANVLLGAAFVSGAAMSVTAVGIPLLTKRIFGLHSYSRIYALMFLSLNLCGAVSMNGVGFLYDLFGSYSPGYILASAVAAAMIALLFLLFRQEKKLAGRQ